MNDVLRPARTRRAADDAPMLTQVVEALIDGAAVQWDEAERRACSPSEQMMTREMRAVARLATLPDGGAGRAARDLAPSRVLERALNGVAGTHVLAAVAVGLLIEWRGAAPVVRLACMTATAAIAAMLLQRGRWSAPARLTGHLLLLVAAAQARFFVEFTGEVGVTPWLRSVWEALVVEAFVPVAAWRLATSYPPVVRCSPFERVSAPLHALALACSIGTAALCGLAVAGARFALLMALAWAMASAITIAVRRRALARRSRPVLSSPARRWRLPAMASSWVSGVTGALRGTPAERLADLAADLQRARSRRELAMTLASHLAAALDTRAIAIVVPESTGWTTLAGRLPTVRRDSAVAALLDSADQVLHVGRRGNVYDLLPPADREWLAIARVSTMVRMSSREGHTLAGVLVGSSPGGRAHDRRDRAFLAAAARVAALALDGIGGRSPALAPLAASDEPAYECQSCGTVSADPEYCACGGRRHLAALPACVHGIFRVERRIGAGGMGVVYLARDLRLDRPVALKTLPTLSSARAGTLRAEARAMATLAHPSVAVLYGLEEWHGIPVLVTEYLSGGTLAARLATRPVPPADAVRLGASVADALAALHARGWLHRDVKPSNIGFCGDGTPKLLDFGLTRWRAAADQSWSPLAGTPLYLSPELLEGEPATARDDVWALALVVVEMITGAHPLQGVCTDSARPHHRPVAVALSPGSPALPPGLSQVLAAALHPSLSQRIVDARGLATALRAAGAAA